jgi:hypothetical protein
MAGDETTGGSGHPFHPFEVNAPHLAYAFLGGFVVLFSLCSLFIKERLYIGEAVVSTVVGIVLGPYALNLFNPGSWGGHSASSEVTDEITLEVTRVVIAVGVFAIGVELPKVCNQRFLMTHTRPTQPEDTLVNRNISNTTGSHWRSSLDLSWPYVSTTNTYSF